MFKKIYIPAPWRRAMGVLNRIFYVTSPVPEIGAWANRVALTWISFSAQKRKRLLFRFSRFTSLIKKISLFVMLGLSYPLTYSVAQQPSSKSRLDDIAGSAGFQESPNNLQNIGINIIVYVLGFVGIGFLGMIIYSGVQWINAGGNENIVDEAKARMKNAVIGFAVVMLAYGLITLILKLLEASASNSYL